MAEGSRIDLGWTLGGKRLSVPLSTILRHAWITGTSGWGKSAFLQAIFQEVGVRAPGVRRLLLDAKGSTADEIMEFLLAGAAGYRHLAPEDVTVVAPFSSYGVALNPLIPIDGLSPEVQANLVCNLIAGLIEGVGQRQVGLLQWLVRAALAAHGSLSDVLAMLREERARLAIAAKIPDAEVRNWLLSGFEQEPRSSISALRSRLEWLLLLPSLRGMLTCGNCLRGPDLIESPLTIVNLSGAPQGMAQLSRFVGGFLVQLVTAAVFSRPVQESSPHVLFAADEWQELLAAGATEDFERLLALGRFKKVAVWCINQAAGAQLLGEGSALVGTLISNISLHVAFRPQPEHIRHLTALLPVTGRKVAPPGDRLFSVADERRMLLEELSRLPVRHALVGDFVEGQARIIKTLSVPFAQARARAGAATEQAREAFARGRFGIPMAELEARGSGLPRSAGADVAPGVVAANVPSIAGEDSPLPEPSSKPNRTGRGRAALVLPT